MNINDETGSRLIETVVFKMLYAFLLFLIP